MLELVNSLYFESGLAETDPRTIILMTKLQRTWLNESMVIISNKIRLPTNWAGFIKRVVL